LLVTSELQTPSAHVSRTRYHIPIGNLALGLCLKLLAIHYKGQSCWRGIIERTLLVIRVDVFVGIVLFHWRGNVLSLAKQFRWGMLVYVVIMHMILSMDW
jgi:hypothetical protein